MFKFTLVSGCPKRLARVLDLVAHDVDISRVTDDDSRSDSSAQESEVTRDEIDD